MQVILLQDVAKIGRRYAVVEVPDGYARNKLIPMKAALPATKETLARYAAERTRVAAGKAAGEREAADALQRLSRGPLHITVVANDHGHLFKAVTKDDIVAAAAAQGVSLVPADLVIESPIKTVGEHMVGVRHGTVVGSFAVTVAAAEKAAPVR